MHPPAHHAVYSIHTYPTHLIMTLPLGRGRSATLRPVLPQDAPLEQDFVSRLSAMARRHRFHAAVSGLSKALVHSLTHIDYLERMGFVVTVQEDGEERVIADACYAVIDAGETAEFAIAVADDWRGLGLGRQLMAALERAAHGAGLRWLHGEVMAENAAMLALMQELGFSLGSHPQDPTLVRVERRVGVPCHSQVLNAAAPGGQPWRRALRRWLRPHALH